MMNVLLEPIIVTQMQLVPILEALSHVPARMDLLEMEHPAQVGFLY